MSNKFINKKILITGASKGLGKAVALAFEKEGANIAVVARSGDKIKKLKESLDDSAKHLFFELDLFEPIAFGFLIQKPPSTLKKLLLVNLLINASLSTINLNTTL